MSYFGSEKVWITIGSIFAFLLIVSYTFSKSSNNNESISRSTNEILNLSYWDQHNTKGGNRKKKIKYLK